MCEVLAVAWNEPQRFERVLPWATDLERLGVAEVRLGRGVAGRRRGRYTATVARRAWPQTVRGMSGGPV